MPGHMSSGPVSRPVSQPVAYILMGVSGCGKTTLGTGLAAALPATYLEGDAWHPAGNVAAMSAGIPLTDEMRRPWLEALGDAAARHLAAGETVVVSCSALRQSYRDLLRSRIGACRFLWLDVPRDQLARRMEARRNHYMPPSLLDSQLAALEPPGAGETDCLRLDGTEPAEALVARVVSQARSQPA